MEAQAVSVPRRRRRRRGAVLLTPLIEMGRRLTFVLVHYSSKPKACLMKSNIINCNCNLTYSNLI